MNKILLLLFLLCTFHSYAQEETIAFGILPTEYAEGMPPFEFQDIEEQIIAEINKIPRYEIIKSQEDYYTVEQAEDLFSEFEAIQKQGVKNNVPYLFQIVFGDTEWSSEQVEVITKKAVLKEGKEVEPAKKKKYWHHGATIWVTLNLYKVETGELIESKTFNNAIARSSSYSQRSKPKPEQDFQTGVNRAKSVLLNRLKGGIKTLRPLNAQVLEPVEENDKQVTKIKIQAGTFHGLKMKNWLDIYYEHPHTINGQRILRQIHVCDMEVVQIYPGTAICKIRKGSKALKEQIAQGKVLKCNFGAPKYYGF